MTAYNTLYDEAIGNYGLITIDQAKSLGISANALALLARRGRLERIGHGVYRLGKYVPSAEGLDPYACAVACVGENAYLWGPSVLAIHHLCPTNPAKIYVGTPVRYRGKSRNGIIVKDREARKSNTNYEGIETQSVAEAILSSQHLIMLDRLMDAARVANERNMIDSVKREQIIKELYIND